jgi:DNA-directed RNA polymerase subunit H (RpoH/RPB5)
MERATTSLERRPSSNVTHLKGMMEEMDMDFKLVDRYFKIHRTIVDMLEVRGYCVSDEERRASNNLHDFMRFLKQKKDTEIQDRIIKVVSELLNLNYIVEHKSTLDLFIRRSVPELIGGNPIVKDISDEILTHFKTTSKLTRDLEDVLEEKLRQLDVSRAVEFLNQVYHKSLSSNEKILVYYYYNSDSEKRENKKRMNDVIIEVINIQKTHTELKDILFIAESKLNTQVVDDLRKYTEKMRITIFLGDYLLFNITKHFLVPKHHLMTQEEMKDFLKDKERGFVNKLPKIYETDPISRFYGAKSGQIFKIIRENLSDDSMIRYSEFYRYVAPEVKK